MGREIRRVPANWAHPKYTEDTATRRENIGYHIPLHDDHAKALNDFEKDIAKKGLKEAIDYWGGGPQSENYAQYDGKPLDWWQAYETVSEGTPVSPAFATPEELIEYLAANGDFWDQRRMAEGRGGKAGYSRAAAEAFVRGGWAPSMIIANGKCHEGAEGLLV
jgi:hypothetical protein